MIKWIIKIWPSFRRFLIIQGFVSTPVAAFVWVVHPLGLIPKSSAFFVFIGIVAFLLGAKAQDDPR